MTRFQTPKILQQALGKPTAQPNPVPKTVNGWNNAGHFVEGLSEEVTGADSGSLRTQVRSGA
ncbi:hypothetical protein EMIT0P12_21175 [Pseudomonas sp. IT-P12]|jgi:hypothetical protein